MKAIAIQLGRSDATVLFYMCEYGIPSRAQHQLKGRPKSAEAIENHRKTLIGKKHTEEHKEKIRQTLLGRKNYWFPGQISKKGYIYLYEPSHPMADSGGYIGEHRKVMAEVLGRLLTREELVHHKNGIKTDNRPKNLQLTTREGHQVLHAKLRKLV